MNNVDFFKSDHIVSVGGFNFLFLGLHEIMNKLTKLDLIFPL